MVVFFTTFINEIGITCQSVSEVKFNDPVVVGLIAKEFNMTHEQANYHINEAYNPTPSYYPSWYWLKNVYKDDLVGMLAYNKISWLTLVDQIELLILQNSLVKQYSIYPALLPSFFDLATVFENIQNYYFILGGLLFLCVFIFLQVFFIRDVLLLFVVMDLALSVFAVLFSLTGLFFNDFSGLAFFFVLLTLAACETAISLGFLVSFSRRHKSHSLTLSSLKYAVI